MIVTMSSEGKHGRIVLATFHVPNDKHIVIERKESIGFQTSGRSDLQELPPPQWER